MTEKAKQRAKKSGKSIAGKRGVEPSVRQDAIAIVGIGCRYSGIGNADELWQTLMDGNEVVGPYPGGRFAELDRMFAEAGRKPGRVGTDRGGFLVDVAGFDAQFFEISPRESVYVDPQHRLLLEVSWEALEDAGQVRESYAGSSTGVYVGLWTGEYENRVYESATENDFYSITGCGRASASGRVSFTLGLQGPSVTVDTACSSSLVAVHLACEALRAGEIDLALAGGSNLLLGPEIFELFTRAEMLSPDGRCKFGDASADGFVRSEGAGMVVLKRLSRALADKDPIYALIRGSAVNNDGHTSGFLTPSEQGQQQMLRSAWESAAVEPGDIRYIEMHGTGTKVGDPIEIGSVGRVLMESGVSRPCLLGSVKTNLGHTEAASGVTGLIKAALAVRHRMIPPSLHVSVPNPRVAWEELPVQIATEAVDLSMEPGPLLACVNSFGLSGTNAHVVLEEAVLETVREAAKSSSDAGPYMLPVSARTPEALQALLRAHLEAMQSAGEHYPVADVCYTAGARRTHHEQRVGIVGQDRTELEAHLEAAVAGEEADGVVFGRAGGSENKIVFVAPGQGSQWIGMARELFDCDPVFRQVFEQCDSAIASETGWRLSTRVLGKDAERYLGEIDVIQPALFTMSVALAAVWRAWGIEPDAVVGHSMGEVAAAHIAGILNLEDAVAVICRRSRLMSRLRSAGSMATVELSLREVEALLAGRHGLSVGASNGPHTTVISGDASAVAALLKELEAREIYCRQIKVDVASHSAQVDPILEELFTSLSGIRPQTAKIPMLSTVTGEYAAGAGEDGVVMDARYWVENLRHSVLFAAAIEKLSRTGHDTFVELSPHPILLPSIEATAREVNPRAMAVASLRREKPERATLLGSLASLYVAGREIAWQKIYPEDARCVRLPQYPFQRERYWPEPADPARARRSQHTGDTSPLLGRRFQSSLQPGTLLWESQLEIAALPYLNDHRVLRSAVFPASGHLEMALSAIKAARPGERFELREATFLKVAYLPDQGNKEFQLAMIPEGNEAFRVELRGQNDPAEKQSEGDGGLPWTLYSTGVLARVESSSTGPEPMLLEELKKQCRVRRTRDQHYEKTARSGLNYGPAFQLVEEAWVGEQESLCRVQYTADDGERYVIHPALLDACFQAIAHIRPEQDAFKAEDTYLPVAIAGIRLYGAIPSHGDLYTHAALIESDADKGILRVNLRLADVQGRVLAEIAGMEVKRVARDSRQEVEDFLWKIEWVEQKGQENAQQRAEAAVVRLARVSAEDWVVFADRGGIAEAMKVSLLAAGGRCSLVRPGTGFRKIADREYEIGLGNGADIERVLADVAVNAGVPTAVVHLWSLDNNLQPAYDAQGLMGAQAVGSQHVPGVVQAIAARNWQNPPRLWLVTAGAMTVGESDGLPRMENAPMWGVGRSVAREHAELRTALVDLSGTPTAGEARALTLEICTREKEDRIALRGDRRYVARLIHFSAETVEPRVRPLADGEDYRLEISSTGILENIALRACTPVPPRAGEVAIEVVAAGLNFIDVTKVMGIYPGLDPADPIQLGIECAGRIRSVGEGVRGFQIGEEVIAITPSMRTTALMSSSANIPAEMVFRKPAHLSFEEASTTPIAFLTAYYSLVELAHLRPGETVLIHAASGGVGLAAIAIARSVGANIIATVGSQEKEDYLKSRGIEHVFHSRSSSFAAGVMEATGGRGVDVVLNSLTGALIAKGLEVLAPYGRFIELGKRDIYDDRAVGLKVFRKNLSFHAVDLAAAIEERPSYIAGIMTEIMRPIESGEWAPLPVTSFSSAEPSVPFHFMAQAHHIGKISMRMDREVEVLPPMDGKLFAADATYLITGGLGGVALKVAEWMAQNGAGHLVLLSRRAPSPETDEVLRRVEATGARVTALRADVTREADLAMVMERIHASGFSLKGIMHTAAVVDDALMVDLSPDRFLPVMAPKIAGAWNLHAASQHENLDFFVLFSSIAAIHPQPGMGSYAAANAFLDAFAQFLRSQGTPAISINWGGWEQIGLARAAGTSRSFAGYSDEGIRTLSGGEALEALGRVLESKPVQVTAIPIDTDRLAEFHGPENIAPAFADLVSRTFAGSGVHSTRSEILEQLGHADTGQRREIFEAYLQQTLGRVLKLAAHKIDRERPLGSMGLDSLMGLEFVRRLSNALEIAVPATVVFNYPTIHLLAAHLLRRMGWQPVDEPAATTEPAAIDRGIDGKDGAVDDLAGKLSEEDALQALIGMGQRSS